MALRKYENATENTPENLSHEPQAWNLYSTFKYTNPRVLRGPKCIITGQYEGQIEKYRLKRHFFREFADHGRISGMTRALYGPVPNNCTPTYIPHGAKKKLNRMYDDLPKY